MKYQMTRFLLTLGCLFLSAALYAQDKNDLISLWTYSAPEAPYGYTNGTIDIKEVEGTIVGEVTIQGTTLHIPEITKRDDAYHCNLFIDGQSMEIRLTQKDKSTLEGMASGGGMDIPFTCKPAKK